MIVDGTRKTLLMVRDLTETIMKDAQTSQKIRVAEKKAEVMRTLNYSVAQNIMAPLKSISLLAEVLLKEMALKMSP
jgi:hypothetical protein